MSLSIRRVMTARRLLAILLTYPWRALQGYVSKIASKRLAVITRLMLKDIQQDPSCRDYQQGSTLGDAHRHWRRAKLFQQFRLFSAFTAAHGCLPWSWSTTPASNVRT